MISRKVGPYVIGGTSNILRRPDAKPTFVVMTDCSSAYYSQVRELMGPDVLIMMRWTEPNDYQPVDDPERRADEWWARRQAVVLAVPETDYAVFAGYNEKPKSEAAAFCRFELRRLGHLHNSGHHAAVGSWGVGCPDLDEWVTYAPLRMAMRRGDVWDLHEYASSLADIDNRWHVGRFTLPVVEANLGDWPIVISEIGYDIVEGQGQAGWQLQPGASEETCLAMLRKFGAFYDGQPRAVGCGAFQQGGVDPRWRPFNMFGVWPSVVAEYPAQAAPAPLTLALVAPIHSYVRVSQKWNPPEHYGIDFSCVEGTPIYAAMDGIAYRFTDAAAGGGFGRYVRIEGQGHKVYTAHLSEWDVVNGQRVAAGDKIGWSGNTGNSTGPHMHFEVRRVAGSPYRFGAIDPTGLIAWPAAPTVVPTVEPLPNDEQGPPAILAQKARYWAEEMHRQYEAGNTTRAQAIRLSLIELLYRLEGML